MVHVPGLSGLSAGFLLLVFIIFNTDGASHRLEKTPKNIFRKKNFQSFSTKKFKLTSQVQLHSSLYGHLETDKNQSTSLSSSIRSIQSCSKHEQSKFACTYFVTSGSHCTVRLGHSNAWVITKSYKNGVFFFQILYSSLIILSSTASSKGSERKTTQNHAINFARP